MINQVKPQSALEQRPNNKPVYINTNCPKCLSPLVLLNIFENPLAEVDKIWNDEFICPMCQDGIYLDLP